MRLTVAVLAASIILFASFANAAAVSSPEADSSNEIIISGPRLADGNMSGIGPKPDGQPFTLWLSDNGRWVELISILTPSPRYGSSMVWEPETGLGLLFGGRDTNLVVFNETWAFDAKDDIWTRLDPPVSPEPRFHSSMVYDPIVGSAVLFGGGNGGLRNDTWILRTSSRVWTNVTPSPSPERRAGHTMAFVPDFGGTLLFGGRGANRFLNDTWLYNATENRWIRIATASAPSPRETARMVWSRAAGGVVLFGGQASPTFPAPLSDTWLFDPAAVTWVQVAPSLAPSAREGHFMASNTSTGEVFVFGGNDFAAILNDTWIFHPSLATWEELRTTFNPPPVYFASGYFDPGTGATIITGGIDRFLGTNRTFAFGLHRPSGTYESHDLILAEYGQDLVATEISWDPSVQPPGTRLRAQLASLGTEGTWNFVGPDGTADSFYEAARGEPLWPGHAGSPVLRVRMYFETTDAKASPELNRIAIRVERPPAPPTPPVLLALAPREVEVGQPIQVEATVEDADGIAWVNLSYTDVVGASREVPMVYVGSTGSQQFWMAEIPAQPAPGIVNYTVRAQDSMGALSIYPPQGSLSVRVTPRTSDGISAYIPWILAAAGTFAVAASAYYVIMRRRRPKR